MTRPFACQDPHPRATYRGDVTSDFVAGLHTARRDPTTNRRVVAGRSSPSSAHAIGEDAAIGGAVKGARHTANAAVPGRYRRAATYRPDLQDAWQLWVRRKAARWDLVLRVPGRCGLGGVGVEELVEGGVCLSSCSFGIVMLRDPEGCLVHGARQMCGGGVHESFGHVDIA